MLFDNKNILNLEKNFKICLTKQVNFTCDLAIITGK